MSAESEAALAGVRVIELAHFVAVPAAGALLADLGADVIKVEQPDGEIYRRGNPRLAGYECDFPESPPFHLDNRGKRSIGLDLTRPEAREALQRMMEGAEIFITNMLPARREKFGLDHTSLLERNPSLVMGAITGYGYGGEAADEPAFDYSACWARSGMMDATRDEGVPPSMLRPGVGDHAAAVNLVTGLLAAMRLRDRTGRGRYVDVSLLQTGLNLLGVDIANTLVVREPLKRHDRKRNANALWNSYPVAGDRWIMLVMIDPNRYWDKFCGAIERPDLRDDERYADGWVRSANSEALIAELEGTFAARSLEEWKPRLDAAGIIWAPVMRVDEAIEDSRARGCFREIQHPTAGPFETLSPPFRIEGEEIGARRGAPELHADARDILGEAGLSDDEIEKLV
ncbi:MAG: CoA transferase [Deltaproteobacteria bacterium]|nr:CoA transferase [Deltaproteobacteria bacterium]MBW2417883.1 CoA transferase [Deltaproteobacteria bacterium]